MNYKHGHCRGQKVSPEYRAWADIKSRCMNTNNSKYLSYGARGIEVCSRWLDPESGFQSFLSDLGPRPQGASLDRIDNSKGYSPENCRWTDIVTQANNKRSNVLISWMGRTKTLAEWGRALGVPYRTLQSRYRRGELFGEVVQGEV